MTVAIRRPFPVEFVRQQFPSLRSPWVFMDNAGGSQILQPVLDRINEYLLTSNVQLGATYGVSEMATARLELANQQAANWVNAADPSEIVMGPSTSMLLRILARGYGQMLAPGDEVIVTNCDHEANITPWKELQHQGIKVKVWSLNPVTLRLELADLEALMTERTRLVTVVHASNVLGTINPIRAIADCVHRHGAQLCVDGVGYAPHRLVDVRAMDVDFYVFSFYKVYGPHHAILYGKRDLLLRLPGCNHDFIPAEAVPYKFQPGGANYELSYGTLGISDYLKHLGQQLGTSADCDRNVLRIAFDAISHYEEGLSKCLLDFLSSHPRVKIIGESRPDQELRVPTIAFVVEGVDSSTIPPQVDTHHIGIRYGDFYAKRLIADLGLTPQNGVVRVSLVHYNTLEECSRLVKLLETIVS